MGVVGHARPLFFYSHPRPPTPPSIPPRLLPHIVRPTPPSSLHPSFCFSFRNNTAGLPFTPAPRETAADASGDIRTRDRQLKTSVFLAIRSNAEGNASGPRWTLPSAIVAVDGGDGGGPETLLEAAKRAVAETAGSGLKLWCPGNAPMAANVRVYNPNLPEEFRGGCYGEKVLYYRVQHDAGDVDAESVMRAGGGIDDWGWLSKKEIVERIEGERGGHQAKFFRYML